MWLPSVLVVLWIFAAEEARAEPEPDLLRVPKVYNAVITSNQNLAPSRAYPVIQPVVHRTAIGYVPPFYYTQLGAAFVGTEVEPGVVGNRAGGGGREGERREGGRRQGLPSRPDEVESVETTDDAPSGSNSPAPKKIARPNSRDVVDSSGELSSSENADQDGDKGKKKGKNDRVPLSFYPNYQSLYYDPYFYPYNAFPPHLAAPGTYYVDYPQPPGLLGPLPPPPPPPPPIGPIGPPGFPVSRGRPETPNERSGQESTRRSEKQKISSSERREKIPDVPPPPLPTTMRKKNS